MKLNLGCGTTKMEGFIGVDIRKFGDNVEVVCDLGNERWPFDDESVEEIHCSHMVEHLNQKERVHFANEACRVMKKGAKALIITPHWSSSRAYGDMTHQWPPVSEFWYPYLNAEWRKAHAPHNVDYTCDFDWTPGGYSVRPDLVTRNPEYQQYALQNFKEACQDLAQTIIKR